MPGQDWLDVEPFFDALEQEQAEPVIAVVTESGDLSATIDWTLNPLPVGTSLYAAPQQQTKPAAWLYQTKSGFRKCWLADEQDDPKFLADRAATLEFPSAHSWTPLYAGGQQAEPNKGNG
jgi:hypothetical protein